MIWILICTNSCKHFVTETNSITLSYHCVGYFTSRSALKAYTRKMNNFLQVCKQIESFGQGFAKKSTASSLTLGDYIHMCLDHRLLQHIDTSSTCVQCVIRHSLFSYYLYAAEALAVDQHHDAVS